MRHLLLLFVLVFSSGQLMAEEISTRDFAAGYYLEIDKNAAVYALELPEDVYHTVKSADLRDVEVFNGAGELVPHEFRILTTDLSTLREEEPVPFFPLFQEKASKDTAGVSLQVSRDAAGAIININSDQAANQDDQQVTGYLLDLSHLKQTLAELEFYWQKDVDSSVFTVNIEQSDDLVRWTPLVNRATLADLQFGGQMVERRNVQLPRQPRKYLKLSWQESRWPLRLTKIVGFSQVIEARRDKRWVSLFNGVVLDKNKQIQVDFTSNYRLPTSSAKIRFPETNSIARLSIQSRPDVDATWRTRCEQVFYDLSFEGASIKNEPCDFPITADSLWRVVVKQDGAGLLSGNRAITLQLGWQPSELLFIGRGTPPYLLAFGSGKRAQQDKNPTSGMLLQTIKNESSTKVISQAKLGRKISLGGELALQSPAKPPPWKKWLLWSVLILGVGLLAFMARSLIKEMKAAEEKKVFEER